MRSEDTAPINPPRKSKNFQKRLQFLVNSLLDLLNTSDQASNCLQVSLSQTKLRSDLQNWKIFPLLITMQRPLNIEIHKSIFRSNGKTTNFVSLLSKGLSYILIRSYLQKLSSIIIMIINNSTKTNLRWKQMWNNWEQFRCVTHLTLFVVMIRAILILVGTWTVRKKCVLGIFTWAKNFFRISTQLINHVLNKDPYIRSVHSKEKTNYFLLMCNHQNLFLKRRRNQVKILLEMSFVTAVVVQDKSVSMSLHEKVMAKTVTNVCNSQSAATTWKGLLRIKNRHLFIFTVMGYIAWPKELIVTSPPIAISHTSGCAKMGEHYSVYGINASTPPWFIQATKKLLPV